MSSDVSGGSKVVTVGHPNDVSLVEGMIER